MKFFHLSDLHIGKQLHHYNMQEDQRYVFAQIAELAEQECPDAVVIAGDIYDTPVPSAEAVSVFDAFLSSLDAIEPHISIFIIAGNHDSARRIDFASSILRKHSVYIAGMPPIRREEYLNKVTLEDAYGLVDFYLLPFLKPSYVRNLFDEEIAGYDMAVKMVLDREKLDSGRRNVLISHQFYTAGGKEPQTSDSEVRLVGGLENVDVSALEPFDYAALGHIHRKQKMGKEKFRYSGSPLAYSVSEAGDLKSITVVELGEKGTGPVITELPLHPHRSVYRLRGTLEEILGQADEETKHGFVSITLTDEVDPYQPRVRLEEKYHHILEICVDNARTRKLLDFKEEEAADLNPYEAFVSFFTEMNGRELTEEEDAMIKEIINQEMEDWEG